MSKYQKNYTSEIEKIIKDTKLNKEQQIKLKDCLSKIDNKELLIVFPDIYSLYISDFSTKDIANIYNKTERTIQLILKKLNLNRTRKDAQRIGAKKRDYIKIREKAKKTALNRQADNLINGSDIEQYVRNYINIELCSKLINSSYEAIVGVNTTTSVGELDIPIIIINNNNYYKFGIEVNGIYYHNNKEKDLSKIDKFKSIGYNVFSLYTKAYSNLNNKIVYSNDLNKEIDKIIESILLL